MTMCWWAIPSPGSWGIARADALTLLIPTVAADGTPAPRLREVRVAGDFDAGSQEQDGALLLANLADLRAMGAARSDMGLRLRYANALEGARHQRRPAPAAAPESADHRLDGRQRQLLSRHPH